jgi:hypothetical protein
LEENELDLKINNLILLCKFLVATLYDL